MVSLFFVRFPLASLLLELRADEMLE